MKKQLLILVAALVFGTIISANAQDSFLQKYSKMKGVEYVEIPFGMFSTISGLKIGSESTDAVDLGSISGSMKGMVILTVDDMALRSKVERDIEKELSDSKYKTLMNVNSDGSYMQMYIMNSQRADSSAFVMYVQDEEEIVFISITGDFSQEDISNVMSGVTIKSK